MKHVFGGWHVGEVVELRGQGGFEQAQHFRSGFGWISLSLVFSATDEEH